MHTYYLDIPIKKLIGSAMYVAIAVALKREWSRYELEKIIDGRKPGHFVGKYVRLCNGIIFNDTTCKNINERMPTLTNGYFDVFFWKTHPFWKLLTNRQPNTDDINNALLMLRGDIRNYIWKALPQDTFSFRIDTRNHVSEELINNMAQIANFESLVALTALSREAHINQFYEVESKCIKAIRKIIVRAICFTPELYIRWPLLLLFYIEPVWHHISVSYHRDLGISHLEDEIYEQEKIARSRGVLLPPKNLFRRINQKELKFLRKNIQL